jgi:hypothetical protein
MVLSCDRSASVEARTEKKEVKNLSWTCMRPKNETV